MTTPTDKSEASPINWQFQSGPCQLCGATNYPLFGGPSICPACDCGENVPGLHRHIAQLKSQLTDLQNAIFESCGALPGVPEVEQVKTCVDELRAQVERLHADGAVMRGALESVLNHAEDGSVKRVGGQCTLCNTYRKMI